MEPLQLKATMMPGTRRADGSVTLKQVTMEEVSTEQFAEIDSYRQVNGWLLFAPNPLELSDIPKEKAVVEGDKSPSQLLREALYARHRSMGGQPEDFELYYRRQMERFRQKVIEGFGD